MRTTHILATPDQLGSFCRVWGVVELSLFGSVLHKDFGPDSDVDLLVWFEREKTLTLESYTEMRDLSRLFGGREIDLLEVRRPADPYRRHETLRTREGVYAC